MNAEAKFHPAEELLTEFVAGTLSAGMNVVISAHVEHCAECREQVARLEAEAAAAWLQSTDAIAAAKDSYKGSNKGSNKSSYDGSPQESLYSPMLESITSQPQQREAEITNQPQQRAQGLADDLASTLSQREHGVQPPPSPTAGSLSVPQLEQSVPVPKVLAKIASNGLAWKKLAGGIKQATVTLDNQTQCEFFYMEPGSRVPVHRHEGTEVTLILDGSFSDELGNYKKADFLVRDNTHTHQPFTEEGCLCFAVLDSPVSFTRGLARLLNPFLRYQFKRATSMG